MLTVYCVTNGVVTGQIYLYFFILRFPCYFAVEGRGQVPKACFIILFCNTSKSSVLDFKVFNMLSVKTYYVFFFFIILVCYKRSESACS